MLSIPIRITLAAGLTLILLSGCDRGGQTGVAPESALISADGSSTVYPLTREAARRFARANGDVVSVLFSGTTAGFRRFCAGETDISNASRAMNAEEAAACAENGITYRQLGLAKDAMAVVVNPANTWLDSITVDELRRLWEPQAEGRIMTWKGLRQEWPDEPIGLFGRGQDSGTYDVFTTEIVGQRRTSRMDYTASEDEELLAAGIAKDRYALGFFGIGAYHRHWDTLKLLAVDNGEGPVYPTLDTVAAGAYIPLTRPLYLYVNETRLAAEPLLRVFLEDYLRGLRSWIHFTGYMPLTDLDYQEALQILRAG
jgi:phosphate transport system substrate-binding protein